VKAPETLEDLKTNDGNYPHSVLVGCETALVVFAAGFLGQQDAVWIADAGLRATLVDEDAAKLNYMRGLYPDDWKYHCADAYAWCSATEQAILTTSPNGQWDIVSLDPWTNQFDRCADMIATWCRLARHAVIIGTGTDTVVEPPAGWEVTDVRKRTDYDGGVFWTVLEPV
jgi:hypothetical protein